jgi:hypothetical protein
VGPTTKFDTFDTESARGPRVGGQLTCPFAPSRSRAAKQESTLSASGRLAVLAHSPCSIDWSERANQWAGLHPIGKERQQSIAESQFGLAAVFLQTRCKLGKVPCNWSHSMQRPRRSTPWNLTHPHALKISAFDSSPRQRNALLVGPSPRRSWVSGKRSTASCSWAWRRRTIQGCH